MENKNYTDLTLWKEARSLVKEVYDATNNFPDSEKYCLTSQIRRAAISIPSNIAEGIGRNKKNDVIQFLYISKGSLYELETQLYLAEDLSFIDSKTRESLLEKLTSIKKLLWGFINYKTTAVN